LCFLSESISRHIGESQEVLLLLSFFTLVAINANRRNQSQHYRSAPAWRRKPVRNPQQRGQQHQDNRPQAQRPGAQQPPRPPPPTGLGLAPLQCWQLVPASLQGLHNDAERTKREQHLPNPGVKPQGKNGQDQSPAQ
jgi:hypothetical protein